MHRRVGGVERGRGPTVPGWEGPGAPCIGPSYPRVNRMEPVPLEWNAGERRLSIIRAGTADAYREWYSIIGYVPVFTAFQSPTCLHQAVVGLAPAYTHAYMPPTCLHADTCRGYTDAVRRTGNDTRTRIEARQRLYW